MSACPYGLDDAAYVLGALPPDEHRAFEEHLAGCAACRTAVHDLAGLPGLLARVEAPAGSGPPGKAKSGAAKADAAKADAAKADAARAEAAKADAALAKRDKSEEE